MKFLVLKKLGFFCATLAVIATTQVSALTVQKSDYLPPPKPTLVAVHWPDLSQLENDVKSQITLQQETLAAAVKGSGASDVALSAAYGTMGQIYHAYSLLAPAREAYVNASRLAPKDFRWIYLLAKLDQQEGRVDEAIRRFRIVALMNPQLVAAHVNLGNIYLELNRPDDATQSFSAAVEIEKQNPAAEYGLGQVALSRRRYADAVTHFEKALALAPEANRINYALAMAYRGLSEHEKAKIHLARQGPVGVRVADPLMDTVFELVQGARIYLVRGKQALEAKRYEEAAVEFRKAIAANPESVPAHVNLGAALTQLRDLKGAAEEFQKALRIDHNNTNAHYNLAVLLANENNHAQAVVHLQAVSAINPNDLGAAAMLSRLLAASPHAKVRDGSRALKLAQALYNATGSLQHGALVGLALSELQRCHEAAEWQRKLIAEAVRQRNPEMEASLKADLPRYENVKSCRPPGNW